MNNLTTKAVQEHISQCIKNAQEKLFNARNEYSLAVTNKALAAKEGDLRENAEYHAEASAATYFSYEMRDLAETITRLEEFLTIPYVKSDFISLKSKFSIRNQNTGEVYTCVLVTPDAGDAAKGFIPTNSKIGEFIQGKTKGDVIHVKTSFDSYDAVVVGVGYDQ